MPQAQREVMYVGRKARKGDNVTNSKGRVWNGLGDVQLVTELEALTLIRHPDIWQDVTQWNEKQRVDVCNEVREKMRAEKRLNQREVPLSLATLEELEAQREKLIGMGKKMPAKTATSKNAPIPPMKPGEVHDDHSGDPVSRPGSQKEVIDAIVGAIMQLDPGKPELFDSEQNPTLEAVIDILGYPVSASELKAANKEIS